MDKFTKIQGENKPTARDEFLAFILERCIPIAKESALLMMQENNPAKVLLSAAMSGYTTGAIHTMDSETSDDPIQNKFRSLLRAFQIEHEAHVRKLEEMAGKEKGSRN